MAVKEKQIDHTEEIEWNVDNEIQLFFAMNGHKPVGINKYFHMVCIWEKFRAAIHKDVSLKVIWDHLESMYDLVALDDTEDLPFPSNETDFALPESEFSTFIKSRKKDESDVKSNKDVQLKEKHKEIRKDKDVKEFAKKDIPPKDLKSNKEVDKKKEEPKKSTREVEVKRDKLRDLKDVKKDHKSPKGRPKGKDEEELVLTGKKERKDSESSRDGPKRAVKRPTRQSVDNTSKASSSPRDTPPPKRRRI